MNPSVPPGQKFISSLRTLENLANSQAVPLAAVAASYYLAGRRAVPGSLIVVFGVCLVVLFLNPVIGVLSPGPGALSNYNFKRINYAMPFLVILAAGAGLSKVTTNGGKPALSSVRGLGMIPAMLTAALALWAVGQDLYVKFNNLRYYAHGSNYAVLYDNPAMRRVAALKSDRKPFRLASTVFIDGTTHLLRASFPWTYGLETADGYVNTYPRRYQELWVKAIAPSADKTPFHYDKMRDWGNRLYLPAKSDRCRSLRIGDFADLDILSLLNVRFIVSPCPLTDSELSLFAENRDGPGQAWHDYNKIDKFLSSFKGDFPSKEIFVYENAAVLPRYFLAGSVAVFDKPEQTLAAIGEASTETLRTTAMMSADDAKGVRLPQGPAEVKGSVRIVAVKNDEIRLEVVTDREAVLVAANSYNPRWTATVNAEERKVFRAFHALQGVVVGKGRSEVVLRYRTAMSQLLGGL